MIVAAFAVLVPSVVATLYFVVACSRRATEPAVLNSWALGACCGFLVAGIAHISTRFAFPGAMGLPAAMTAMFLYPALPAELTKLLAVTLALGNGWRSLGARTLVAASAAAAGGYVALEGLMRSIEAPGGLQVAVLGSVSAIPGHLFSGAVMGMMLVLARRRPAFWILALAAPVALHALYSATRTMAASTITRPDLSVPQMILWIFLAVLVVNGVLAHLCVSAAGRIDGRTAGENGDAEPEKTARPGTIDRLVASPASWAAASLISLIIGAIAILIANSLEARGGQARELIGALWCGAAGKVLLLQALAFGVLAYRLRGERARPGLLQDDPASP